MVVSCGLWPPGCVILSRYCCIDGEGLVLFFGTRWLDEGLATVATWTMMINGRTWMVVGGAAPSVTCNAELCAAEVYLRHMANESKFTLVQPNHLFVGTRQSFVGV